MDTCCCVDSRCYLAQCLAGWSCREADGRCVDPCAGVTCAGEVCSPPLGTCAPDPCLFTLCGDCQTCRTDAVNLVASCAWAAACAPGGR